MSQTFEDDPVTPPGPPRRLLIVDDEPALRRCLARVLRDAYLVDTVGSAAETLRRLRAGERFDAFLVDMMMPGGSGLDLHDLLEQEFPASSRRVVFMTGGLPPELRRRADELRNPCLGKPLDIRLLRETLWTVIRASGDTEAEVNDAIRRRLRARAHFSAHARFVEDLGADSLDMAELMLVLEETFDIAIPDEQAAEIRTVHDALVCVERWLHAPLGK